MSQGGRVRTIPDYGTFAADDHNVAIPDGYETTFLKDGSMSIHPGGHDPLGDGSKIISCTCTGGGGICHPHNAEGGGCAFAQPCTGCTFKKTKGGSTR